MDVTSLLNASSRPNVPRRTSRESTPHSISNSESELLTAALPTPSPERTLECANELRNSRGRLPWNAGGYALPLSMATKLPSSLPIRSPSDRPRSNTSNDTVLQRTSSSRHGSTDSTLDLGSLRVSTPPMSGVTTRQSSVAATERRTINRADQDGAVVERLPGAKHRISHSNSSLSSCGSSQSGSHSRISSATTVNEFHTIASSVTEMPLLESGFSASPESVAGAILRHIKPNSPGLSELNVGAARGQSADVETIKSPTDVLLRMKMPNKGSTTANGYSQPPPSSSRISTNSSFHKRAISAPDFALRSMYPNTGTPKYKYPLLPPPQPMASCTRGQSIAEEVETATANIVPVLGRDDVSEQLQTSEASRRTLSPKTSCSSALLPEKIENPTLRTLTASPPPLEFEQEAYCMFVKDCNTGSQLRKAISHLFGRNKACTLRIPKEVWVYYCRKHYQRIRYRNAKTYPLNQMELVKLQIARLQAWSAENQRRAHGPYIKLWTLSLRKREQNRLDKETGIDEGDDENQGSQNGSAAPEWIIQRLGAGYTTEQMMNIADRLHGEIKSGLLNQVPEIEFLPDIVDPDDGGSAKPARPRKASRATNNGTKMPKRKATNSMDLHDNNDTKAKFTEYRDEEDIYEVVGQPGKRVRVNNVHNIQGHYRRQSSHMRTHSLTMPPHHADGVQTSPSRGFNAVPRIRPLEYLRSSGGHESQLNGYAFIDHPRSVAFSNPFDQDRQSSGSHPPAVGYSQPTARLGNGFSGRQVLPSISSQLPEDSSYYAHGPNRLHRAHAVPASHYSPPRPTHQRSASAYAPLNRSVPTSARPSSSGNSAQVAPPKFETRFPGPSAHDQGYWVHNHQGHFAPQHQSFQHDSAYGQPVRHHLEDSQNHAYYANRAHATWQRVD